MTTKREKRDENIQHVVSDLNSLRTIFNWILLGLLVWECIYSTIKYPVTIPTIIMTLGTLCGTMFLAYVGSKTYERTNGISEPTPPSQGLSSDER
jgi:hypothetical protein